MPNDPVSNRFAAWDIDNVPELHRQAATNPPDGYIEHRHSAARLNAVAEYGFVRSRPLFDLADQLAEKDGTVTLNAEEVRTLADGFETMAYRVGDGVLFDKPPAPAKPSVLKRILRWLTPTSILSLPQS